MSFEEHIRGITEKERKLVQAIYATKTQQSSIIHLNRTALQQIVSHECKRYSHSPS
jgi:hypothetical protein